MTVASSDDRPHDRLAIRGLNDDFGWLLDHGEIEQFATLFTEDIDYRNGARRLSGREELLAFFRERAKNGRVSRHIYSGLRIRFTGEKTAESTSVWLTFAGAGALPIRPAEPFAVADIQDNYRLVPGTGWRFASRIIKPVFLSGTIPQLPEKRPEAS